MPAKAVQRNHPMHATTRDSEREQSAYARVARTSQRAAMFTRAQRAIYGDIARTDARAAGQHAAAIRHGTYEYAALSVRRRAEDIIQMAGATMLYHAYAPRCEPDPYR